mgnify:CR=1 FL=1
MDIDHLPLKKKEDFVVEPGTSEKVAEVRYAHYN